ncbi:hypothetical protein SBA4_4250003 [Candidatus Sulfopaludibacter sp. SbA4]|nr:hypothetical protein SBA4_4250003 [Candidatus Sulfopaludibacter sp. SbA4]
MFTKAFSYEREFAEAVKKVEQELGDKVIRIRYSLDYDSTGDPAVKFRIVMPDSSLTKDKLLEATQHVSWVIERELKPEETWGVYPYFNFRAESEQEAMQEPAWA